MIVTESARQLFHEGSLAFAQMESNGVRVDVALLNKTIERVSDRITHLKDKLKSDEVYKQWRKRYADKFSFESGIQLGKVLVDRGITLPETASSKKGARRYKSDEATLEKINLPFIKSYFEIKKLLKLRSTNLLGIQRELIGDLLRSMYNLHNVVTFRSSSDRINFQNLPNRNPLLAKLVRRLFIPRDGHALLEIDLKANEVRVACSYTKDRRLIEDTLKGDMHRDMAAECFRIPQDEVPKAVRHVGKNGFVFPEFYGDYYKSVAPSMWEMVDRDDLKLNDGTTVIEHLARQGLPTLADFTEHVRRVEDNFWNVRYKTYTKWKEKWWSDYNRKGGFITETGFVVRTNKIGMPLSRNECINSPIQGSAFHCLLWVLIELQKWLKKNKMRTLMVGQIHDSIELDVHLDELDDVLGKAFELLRYDIRKAWPWLICPLEGEAELAESNWYEKKEIPVPDTGRDESRVTCVACGDTGKNSKGGPCVPCIQSGRV